MNPEPTPQEVEEMKKRVKQLEEEAAKLRELDAQYVQTTTEVVNAESMVADSRSVFVKNVEYSSAPEDLQTHFQSCGAINRITIPADKFGNGKGYAYIEFADKSSVPNALVLSGSVLNNRVLEVIEKRTNIPGFNKVRGRGRGRGLVRGRGRGSFRGRKSYTPY